MPEPKRVAIPGTMVFLCQGCHGDLYMTMRNGTAGGPAWRCVDCYWLWEYTAVGWRRVQESR
jgi:hypothetical protein